MPWEKSFDIDNAVDLATKVFWSKGYESASLADLLKAMNINKGSFYNAFGSKKKLFTLGLLKYDREQRKAMLTRLTTMQDPIAAVSTLFDECINQSLSDAERKGCFMVNTALNMPHHDDDIIHIVKKSFAELEDFFKQQIVLGQEADTIPMSVQLDVTAKALVTLVVGLRVVSRGIFDTDSLGAIKKQALDLIK